MLAPSPEEEGVLLPVFPPNPRATVLGVALTSRLAPAPRSAPQPPASQWGEHGVRHHVLDGDAAASCEGQQALQEVLGVGYGCQATASALQEWVVPGGQGVPDGGDTCGIGRYCCAHHWQGYRDEGWGGHVGVPKEVGWGALGVWDLSPTREPRIEEGSGHAGTDLAWCFRNLSGSDSTGSL